MLFLHFSMLLLKKCIIISSSITTTTTTIIALLACTVFHPRILRVFYKHQVIHKRHEVNVFS